MKRFAVTLGVLVIAGQALGQSFNIDFENPNGGPGSGVPPAAFGAAANQPGHWNAISSLNQIYTLANRQGIPTGVTLDTQGPSSITSVSDQRTWSEFEDLLEDGFRLATEDDTLFFNFHGLAPGPYFLYSYARTPDSEERETRLTVGLFGYENIGGSMFYANEFYEGITHSRRLVRVDQGTIVHVEVRTNPAVDFANGFIAGFQIEQVPTRLYVNASAPAGGDGRSWTTAFNDLQNALAQSAVWSPAVEEIWVAQGAYYPSADVPADPTDSFGLLPGVAVLGGFAGNETELDQRMPGAHPTVLSGNIGGPLPNDNSSAVVTSGFAGTDSAAVLDGFTVIGGDGGRIQGRGAGLFVFDGAVIARNCRFVNNTAAVAGGALFVKKGSAMLIDCEFVGNSAATAGGAYSNSHYDAVAQDSASATFINCRFHNNDGDLLAGAVDLQRGSTSFVNCVFTGNDATWKGGAIYAVNAGTAVHLSNCSLAGNTAVVNGGAVAIGSGAAATISNSILWDNHAGANYEGTIQSQIALGGVPADVTYTTVQFYLPLLLPGTGNNGLNPQFVNATGGDGYGGSNDNLRLAAGSPMIDAGNNDGLPMDLGDLDGDTHILERTPLDLDRHARRADDPGTTDTGNGAAPVVDRGAYEFGAPLPPPPCTADFNGDGVVNSQDFFDFLTAFFGSPPPSNADFNADGIVNSQDFFDFITAFFSGC